MSIHGTVAIFSFVDAGVPGKIMRLTIPKSQGKQPFYDARKSGWGDIFPHEPKNKPQEKHSPPGARPTGEANFSMKSREGGKRSKHDGRYHKSYSRLAGELTDNKRKIRQQRLFAAKSDDLVDY